MVVILPKSVFFHVPKAGGTWVTQVLLEGVKGAYKIEPDIKAKDDFNGIHLPTNRMSWKGKSKFIFIRHPLSWYQSIWKYHNTHQERWFPDPENKNDFYKYCPGTNFALFMDKVMKYFPTGYYNQVLDAFLDGADIVGKQENLKNDLENILKKIGEDVEPLALDIPATNVSKDLFCDYTKVHKDFVLKVESSIIERYYE